MAIRGGKPIKLPVHAEAVLPAVTIDEDELAFEPVYQGGQGRQPLTLRNVSIAAAQLTLDLRAPRQDFSLELVKDSYAAEDYDGESPLSVSKGLYTIRVAPSKSLSFFLAFRPTLIQQHAFELPLTIQARCLCTRAAPCLKQPRPVAHQQRQC